jgi:hypothetical protein
MSPTKIGTSNSHWFSRGIGAGILLMAGVNAASYFARSDGWGNLLGNQELVREALGFPLEFWEAGNSYGGFYAAYSALAVNALFALGLGAILGLFAVSRRNQLNAWVAEIEAQMEQKHSRNLQFTIGGLLMGTAVVAVAASVARTLTPRPEALAAIYLCGPTTLIIGALIPYRISWQHRVAILITAACLMMAVAIAIGNALKIEFDKVLLSIFICWTPQSTLMAVLIIIGTVVYRWTGRAKQTVVG